MVRWWWWREIFVATRTFARVRCFPCSRSVCLSTSFFFFFPFRFCSSSVGVERELYQVRWISSVTANCGGMKTGLLARVHTGCAVPFSGKRKGRRTRCEEEEKEGEGEK